jgi:hypothetical protein
LNKIRSIIESTTDVTPEVFWAKIHPYLKEDMFACALIWLIPICMHVKGKETIRIVGSMLTDYTMDHFYRKCFLK